jgi:hypothetical protein
MNTGLDVAIAASCSGSYCSCPCGRGTVCSERREKKSAGTRIDDDELRECLAQEAISDRGACRPLWMTLAHVYAHYLESPGTKAYSVDEAKCMFASFSAVQVRTVLTHEDLLESEAGQRHGGLSVSGANALAAKVAARVRALSRAMHADQRRQMTQSHSGGFYPNNPWGIAPTINRPRRRCAKPVIRSRRSRMGGRVLLRLAREKIRSHHFGLGGRTLQQLRNTILAPFSWGEPDLGDTGARYLDVLRQELKVRLGVGINEQKLSDYRARGSYAEAKRNERAVLALTYQVVTVGLGCLILLLGLLGMILTPFQAGSRSAPMPELE